MSGIAYALAQERYFKRVGSGLWRSHPFLVTSSFDTMKQGAIAWSSFGTVNVCHAIIARHGCSHCTNMQHAVVAAMVSFSNFVSTTARHCGNTNQIMYKPNWIVACSAVLLHPMPLLKHVMYLLSGSRLNRIHLWSSCFAVEARLRVRVFIMPVAAWETRWESHLHGGMGRQRSNKDRESEGHKHRHTKK